MRKTSCCKTTVQTFQSNICYALNDLSEYRTFQPYFKLSTINSIIFKVYETNAQSNVNIEFSISHTHTKCNWINVIHLKLFKPIQTRDGSFQTYNLFSWFHAFICKHWIFIQNNSKCLKWIQFHVWWHIIQLIFSNTWRI